MIGVCPPRARSVATRATPRSPHHPVAARRRDRDALDRPAVDIERGANDRQVVRA